MKSRVKFWSLAASLAILLAVLGFAFAQPVRAADTYFTNEYLEGNAVPPPPNNPDNDNCSTYAIGAAPSGDAVVTLIVEAGDVLDEDGYAVSGTRFRKEVSVNLGGHPKTVSGLLQVVSDDFGPSATTDDLKFYGKGGTGLVPFTPSTNYVAAIEHKGKQWIEGGMTGTWGFNGWEFRLNDKFPVKSFTGEQGPGWTGTDILETPVVSGDVVHFMYEFPSNLYGNGEGSGNIAAKYVRAVCDEFVTSPDKQLVVQFQRHVDYINPNNENILELYNYVDITSADVYLTPSEPMSAGLYELDGTPVQVNQPVNPADGKVTFTDGSLTRGKTYIVKSSTAYYTTTDDTWGEIINNAFLSRTGAYAMITIPSQP